MLSHHFLLPTERLSDPRFFEALIYICRHSQDGAWGFVVNQPSTHMTVGSLLAEMRIDGGAAAMKIPAMKGGVMRLEAGFVLHTGLPEFYSSLALSENICLTTSKDVLSCLAPVPKVRDYMVLMGFCAWHSGQLEQEISAGDWLVCAASEEILFEKDHSKKLAKCHEKLGLNPNPLAPVVGTA